MMTLPEFLKTATRVSIPEACDAIGVDSDFWEGSKVTAIWLYADTLYVEELDSGFGLLLERDYWEGSQDELATRLYFEWYVSECSDPAEISTSDLTQLLECWSKWRGLEVASADEMLHAASVNPPELRDAKTRESINWLQWFCNTWERVQLREDGKGFGGRA